MTLDTMEVDDELPLRALFPLPYRVLALSSLGILAWAVNLHGLDYLGIDAVSAMKLGTGDYEYHHPPSSPLPSARLNGFRLMQSNASAFYTPIYRLFRSYSLLCLSSWCLFYYATRGGNVLLVDVFGYIPGITALFLLIALICPFDVFQKREREMFLKAIHRCITPSPQRGIYFADVVFADIFTSFAKVLGDFWLSFVMLMSGNTLLIIPTPSGGWTRWIVPTILSLPYFTRLRQCIAEYRMPENESRRPLFNAVKYATSFPVIYLSAAQKLVVSELISEKGDEIVAESWHGEHPLFRLWLLAAIVNSLYSFWWDVTNDWGLDLLKPRASAETRNHPPRRLVLPHLHSRSSSLTQKNGSSAEVVHDTDSPHLTYPWGLRSTLSYPLPVYPLLIFFNLLLRLTWSIKLSSHLHSHSDGSVVIFWLEVAEVVRRWMWVFIRVEWEVVRKGRDVKSHIHSDLGEDEYEFDMIHTAEEEDGAP